MTLSFRIRDTHDRGKTVGSSRSVEKLDLLGSSPVKVELAKVMVGDRVHIPQTDRVVKTLETMTFPSEVTHYLFHSWLGPSGGLTV